MSFIVQPVTPPSIFKIAEKLAAGAGGNIDFFVGYYDTLIYTGNASASTVLNITNQTGSTLNEIMAAGDQLNIQFQITNASPAYSIEYIQIDSGAANVEISLADNFTLFTGYPDSITIYNLEIVKNNNNDFTIFAGSDESSIVRNKPNPPSNASATFVTAGLSISFDPATSGGIASIFDSISSPNQYNARAIQSPIIIQPPFVSGDFDFSVAAINAAGFSNYSSPSQTISLVAPTAPTMATATISGSTITVSFSGSTGSWSGLALDYTVISNPSAFSITGSSSPIIFPVGSSGIPPGQIYTFEVQASNYVGIATSSATDAIDLQIKVDYLVIAGGGSGSSGGRRGGGGAGGYREATNQSFLGQTNYLVTVGAGGSAPASGNASIFGAITSAGGGAGNAVAGGSGGGKAGDGGTGPGGAGNTPVTSPSQGNNGGASNFNGYGGGGGGANAVGGVGGPSAGGAGGSGKASSITGTSITRGGGGGGGAWSTAPGGAGGAGGGGAGASPPAPTPNPGVANTGGGGGGTRDASVLGGNGGSGIVIIKYATTYGLLNVGPGLTYSQATSGGNYIYQFTAGSDNISWG